MKKTNFNYASMTAVAKNCGLVEYKKDGHPIPGLYTMEGYEAPVDLSACAEDEKSILKTALKQLSQKVDESYHVAIERDLIS